MPPVESEGQTGPIRTLQQLERILVSPGFARNERLSRFLRFVVERHLLGRDEEIKESLIAVEVFGRPPDYDPKRDAVVRAEASRLRARLGEYYVGQGKDDPVVIELPKGGYVPVIRSPKAEGESVASVPDGSRPLRWPLWAALACLALAAVAVGGWWRLRPHNAPIPIAVLPLINLNQDPANDYFADGLTCEIIRNLAIIDGLVVRSETSSLVFKGKRQSARDAGKALEADFLVEGSVLRSEQHLRINIQFVRARDDFPIWSGRYDRELSDIFAIQDDISRGIVNSLRLKLGRGRRRYETGTEAYDLYLRARALNGTGANFARSIPLFEQAIAADPSFAPAYVGLSVAHLQLSGRPQYDPPSQVAKIRAAAEKAIQLDPLSAEAYASLGAADAREGRWERAEKNFRRAIEIQPDRPEPHGYFGMYYLLPLGRIEEAIRHLRMAQKSDPNFMLFLGDALADAGRNQEAAGVCAKLPSDYPQKDSCLPIALVLGGSAGDVMQRYGALPADNPRVNAALVCAYARTGRREEAEKLAATLSRESRTVSSEALAFACLTDKERVFERLNSATAIGPIRMGWILNRVDRESPGLLRGDPRLKALRKKVGLPD